MPNRYPTLAHMNYAYFVTCTIVDWLPVFEQPIYRQIVLDSLAYVRAHKKTQLNAFVIMSTHLHAVLWPENDASLSDILRDFKRFTSRSISKLAIQMQDQSLISAFQKARQASRAQEVSTYQVWQEGSHPEAIFTSKFAAQKINYIHENPVRAGLVTAPENWEWSSARAYVTGEYTYPGIDLLTE